MSIEENSSIYHNTTMCFKSTKVAMGRIVNQPNSIGLNDILESRNDDPWLLDYPIAIINP
jgi:hypothetical protein